MKERTRTVEEIENVRSLARKAWKLGWAIFALGAVTLATIYLTKEPSQIAFMAGASLLSMSVWILFASKFVEKRNPLPKD
jgi:hypothetical protein